MMPAQSRVEAGIWRVPGHAPVIEYGRPVLERILTHVVEAYDSYLAGGYEVGGVLFGQRDGSRIRIKASRPLVIQPPRPSFVLAGEDERRLHELIGSASRDPELAGTEPVGWYHSHTRSEIFLSESDLDLYDRFFPEPWQVAMVLRPESEEPVRIGFFFRENDGFIRTDQTYFEFAVDPPLIGEKLRRLPPWRFNELGEVSEDSLPMESLLPSPALVPALTEPVAPPSRARSFPWLFLLLAIASVAVATMSIAWIRSPDPPIGFAIRPVGQDLMLMWDPSNAALKNAEQITVELRTERKLQQFVLNAAQIRSGRFRVGPHGRKVEAFIAVPSSFGRTRKDTAIFIAHPQYGELPPALAEAKQQESEALVQVEGLQRQLDAEQSRSEALTATMHDLEKQREQIKAGLPVDPPVRAANLPPPPKPFTIPAPKPNQQAAALRELPDAPVVASRDPAVGLPVTSLPRPFDPPPAPAPARTAPAPQQPVQQQPLPQQAVPLLAASKPPISTPPPAAAKPNAPLSGRLIWTGELPRNGLLTIDGRHASRGFVNSELPDGPIRIGAHAADLTEEGLKIRTGNPKYAGQPTDESPNAANGWNRTSYVYDQSAFQDVFVEQLPDAKDRRIVLRAGAHRLSVIVIEWQVISQ